MACEKCCECCRARKERRARPAEIRVEIPTKRLGRIVREVTLDHRRGS